MPSTIESVVEKYFVRAIQRKARAKNMPPHSERGHAGAVEYPSTNPDANRYASFWTKSTTLRPHRKGQIQAALQTKFRLCAVSSHRHADQSRDCLTVPAEDQESHRDGSSPFLQFFKARKQTTKRRNHPEMPGTLKTIR